MKLYPSIPREITRGLSVYAFDKLDGSNIRAEWNRKHKEFTKFGSRTVLLGEDHPHLGKSIGLIKAKYEKALSDIFLEERWEEATCFFEFYGPKSFAGVHDPTDDGHTVTFFDVNAYKRGQIYPNEFLKLFDQRVEIPKLLYTGNANELFEEQVRSSQLPGITFEGVVCKGSLSLKTTCRPPVMFKIKTRAFLEKLKELCAQRPDLNSEFAQDLLDCP